MKLGAQLLALLAKVYKPSSMIETTFQRYDIAFKTDEQGRPILLYIGRREPGGKIKGERFTRRLLTTADGLIIKDHWDNKGKA
ncbi:hypothetical protein GWR56_15375 [Mucilaginibacter sp. 14171R-50]|uniref:hypothetical protein n=1 Tax=Mucilaginibacter sp. 14171R-50 TaxID=2703789 RepID=UPI00138D413C|nr:hypothetical protein [Mucilaginibacter sp. 14171R-50]QHS56857.1 hypothetical protein GWR56_15375 [Mucilaginibacter sp. 14171R-50]